MNKHWWRRAAYREADSGTSQAFATMVRAVVGALAVSRVDINSKP